MFKLFSRDNHQERFIRLRDELIRLYSLKQIDNFNALCKENSGLIKNHFSFWLKIPEDIKYSSSDRLNEYVQPLIATAHLFKQMGDDSLLSLIQPESSVNPIEKWKATIISSYKLTREGKLNEAKEILLPVLSELDSELGNAKQEFLPKVYGQLGVISYYLKDEAGVINNTHKALELCREYNDLEGVVAYSSTLLELMSQMGLSEEDDRLAKERVAALKLLGRLEEAAKYEIKYQHNST